ncbi:MAG: esterase family protein [Clostridia bacterium]|nr:esterase family protein [Clostridia bacterium]
MSALLTTRFYSDTLRLCVTADVILPQRKDLEAGHPLKCLYLLHGMFGNHSDWQRKTGIERYASGLGLAVVMPSGLNSFYTDMAHGGRYHAFITEELPSKMRLFFPLSGKREDTYIAGLSMGGAGSLSIGLAHPEKYSAIGCLSAGSMVLHQEELEPKYARAAFGDASIEGTRMDPIASAKAIIRNHLPAPRIYHACGTEDDLLPIARKTRDALTAFPGDPFDYTYEESPGGHTWAFWDERIAHFIRFLDLKPQPEWI